MSNLFITPAMGAAYTEHFDVQKSQSVPQNIMLDALWRTQVQKAELERTGRKWCPQMFNADREAKAQLDFLRAAREEIAFSELCSSKTNIRALGLSSR